MLARIWYEGEEYYVEADTLSEAIEVWNLRMQEEYGEESWVDPEVTETLWDGPVIRKEIVK